MIITDNQFFKSANETNPIVSIAPFYFKTAEGSNLSGNYVEDISTIVTDYGVALNEYYPMRSKADVDIDDLTTQVLHTSSFSSSFFPSCLIFISTLFSLCLDLFIRILPSCAAEGMYCRWVAAGLQPNYRRTACCIRRSASRLAMSSRLS